MFKRGYIFKVKRVPTGRRLMALGALPAVALCCDPPRPVDPTPAPMFVTDEATYLASAVPNVDPPTILVVVLEAGPMLVELGDGTIIEEGPAERCASYGGDFRPVDGAAGECDGVDY